MTSNDNPLGSANASDPEKLAVDNITTDSTQPSHKPTANLKAYEWADKWGCKPRQVIQAARTLNMRVQNRLTRIPPSDARRVLAVIQDPTPEPNAP